MNNYAQNWVRLGSLVRAPENLGSPGKTPPTQPPLQGRADWASSLRGVVRSDRLSALDGPSGRSDLHKARDLLGDDVLAEALE